MKKIADFGRRNGYVVVKYVFTVIDCKEGMFYSSRPNPTRRLTRIGVKHFHDDVTVYPPFQSYFIWCLEPSIRRSNKFRIPDIRPEHFPPDYCAKNVARQSVTPAAFYSYCSNTFAWLKETGAQTSSRVQRRGQARYEDLKERTRGSNLN